MARTSAFHATFGYYAHGVGEETATLAEGWRERLVPLVVGLPGSGSVTGLCLEPNDLAISKIAAGRDKDLRFVREMLSQRVADQATIQLRVRGLSDPVVRELCRARVGRLA